MDGEGWDYEVLWNCEFQIELFSRLIKVEERDLTLNVNFDIITIMIIIKTLDVDKIIQEHTKEA